MTARYKHAPTTVFDFWSPPPAHRRQIINSSIFISLALRPNGPIRVGSGPNNKRAEGPHVPPAKGNALVIRVPRTDNQSFHSHLTHPSAQRANDDCRCNPLPTWAFDDNTGRLTRADRRARASAAPSSEAIVRLAAAAAAVVAAAMAAATAGSFARRRAVRSESPAATAA